MYSYWSVVWHSSSIKSHSPECKIFTAASGQFPCLFSLNEKNSNNNNIISAAFAGSTSSSVVIRVNITLLLGSNGASRAAYKFLCDSIFIIFSSLLSFSCFILFLLPPVKSAVEIERNYRLRSNCLHRNFSGHEHGNEYSSSTVYTGNSSRASKHILWWTNWKQEIFFNSIEGREANNKMQR